jgi:hypothetical protein
MSSLKINELAARLVAISNPYYSKNNAMDRPCLVMLAGDCFWLGNVKGGRP